jgi:crotonobetainyl-CoA:carnitine CoA-transferase CaiB-like acyl-CoA transferase
MGPLQGIRVIELGQVIAGTFGGVMFADLGAEVIKVEAPRGDLGRNPQIGAFSGTSSLFLTHNRGKKSVVVDLKLQAGLAVFHRLVERSDIVVDNFRPGVLERLRVDHDTLAKVNPRVISCSITGFGGVHEERGRPSFDLTHQALSGHMSITGEPGRPARAGVPLADLSGGAFGAIAILSALLERERTGRGQRVEVSMLHVMAYLLGYDATMYLNTGDVPRPWGSGHAYHVPWQAFETADGWLVVATREERFWRQYCAAIGRPELAEDARFATNLDRLEHRDVLVPLLEDVMRTRSTGEWLSALDAAEVPVARVNDVGQALAEPSLADGAIVDVPYPPLGTVRMVSSPIRFGASPPAVPGAPPLLGEHTREVLADVAGLGADEIERLEREGVVRGLEHSEMAR